MPAPTTCKDEVTLYDRPKLSVAQVARDGAHWYVLRVREGASKPIVRAAMKLLADKRSPAGAMSHG